MDHQHAAYHPAVVFYPSNQSVMMCASRAQNT